MSSEGLPTEKNTDDNIDIEDDIISLDSINDATGDLDKETEFKNIKKWYNDSFPRFCNELKLEDLQLLKALKEEFQSFMRTDTPKPDPNSNSEKSNSDDPDKLKAEILELKEKLATTEYDYKILNSDLDMEKETIKVLDNHITRLKGELETERDHITRLKGELETERENYSKLKEISAGVYAEIKDLKVKCTSWENRCQSLNDELTTKTDEINRLTNEFNQEIKSKTEELKSVQTKLELETSNYERLETELKTMEDQLQGDVQREKEARKKLMEINRSYSDDNRVLSDKLRDQINENNNLKTNLSRLEESLKEKSSQLERCEPQYRISSHLLLYTDKLLADLKAEKYAHNLALAEIEKLKEEKADLSTKLNTLETIDIPTLENSLKAVKSEFEEKERMLQKQNERNIDDLRKKYANEIQQLKTEIQGHKDNISKLNEDLRGYKESKEKISHLQSMLQKKENEMCSLKDEIQQLKTEIQGHKENISKLNEDLRGYKESKEKISHLQSMLQKKENEMCSLKEIRDKEKEEFRKIKAIEIQQLKDEIQGHKENVSKLNEDSRGYNESKDKIDQLQTMLQKKEEEISSLNEKLETEKNVSAGLRKRIKNALDTDLATNQHGKPDVTDTRGKDKGVLAMDIPQDEQFSSENHGASKPEDKEKGNIEQFNEKRKAEVESESASMQPEASFRDGASNSSFATCQEDQASKKSISDSFVWIWENIKYDQIKNHSSMTGTKKKELQKPLDEMLRGISVKGLVTLRQKKNEKFVLYFAMNHYSDVKNVQFPVLVSTTVTMNNGKDVSYSQASQTIYLNDSSEKQINELDIPKKTDFTIRLKFQIT